MRAFFFPLIMVVTAACGGCATSGTDAVTQASVFNALLAGQYDGAFTQKDVAGWGDLGIGTFDALDGEMVLVDGRAYQAVSGGEVRRLQAYKTPFATVKRFSPETTFSLKDSVSLEALKAAIDARIPDKNHIYAVRVRGHFKAMTVRSVPRQEKPYAVLTDVVKAQPVFEHRDIDGDIVGFRVPEFAQGINVAGYHFHFLSRDRALGGHVFSFEMSDGMVKLDRADSLRIMFPDNEAFRSWSPQATNDTAVKAVESKPMAR